MPWNRICQATGNAHGSKTHMSVSVCVYMSVNIILTVTHTHPPTQKQAQVQAQAKGFRVKQSARCDRRQHFLIYAPFLLYAPLTSLTPPPPCTAAGFRTSHESWPECSQAWIAWAACASLFTLCRHGLKSRRSTSQKQWIDKHDKDEDNQDEQDDTLEDDARKWKAATRKSFPFLFAFSTCNCVCVCRQGKKIVKDISSISGFSN